VQSAVLRSHVVCLSVCPSVCDVAGYRHIGWKSWKLIARTQPNIFALRSPKVIHLLPEEHVEILGRLEVGWEKVACSSRKVAVSLKRVQIEEKLLWGPIGTHQRSFQRHHLRPPTASLPQDWGSHPTQKYNRYYLRNG